MKNKCIGKRGTSIKTSLLLVFMLISVYAGGLVDAANLPNLTVIGVSSDGTETPITDYRWLVEEDLNYHVPEVGGVPQSDNDTLAVSFHRSYICY